MFILDLFVAFLVGGIIGHRAGGARRTLAVIFALIGVGLPALLMMLWWPDWYLHYHLNPGSWILAVWGVLVGCFVILALLGHAVVPGRPVLLPVVGVAVSTYFLSTLGRTLKVGTHAQWVSGTIGPMDSAFVETALTASGFTLVLAVAAWIRSGVHQD